MVEFFGLSTEGVGIPDTSLLMTTLTYFIILLIITVISIVVAFVLIRKLQYKKKIIIFEKVNNQYEPTMRDRARELKIGQSGDIVLYLRKNKKYLPIPNIQTGRNTFWYAIREDGEWANIGVKDIDFSMRLVNARFLDKEMRHARTHLQGIVKDRYNKKNILLEYAPVIAFAILIIIFGIIVYLWFDKMIELNNATQVGTQKTLEQIESVLELLRGNLIAIDNLKGDSGIKPVTPT